MAPPMTTPAPLRITGNFASERSFAAAAIASSPPEGRSNSTMAGSSREAIGHHAARALMCAVPEGDASLGKEIRDGHEGGTYDAERMFDPVHLQDFHECLFGRHFHGAHPWQSDWMLCS